MRTTEVMWMHRLTRLSVDFFHRLKLTQN